MEVEFEVSPGTDNSWKDAGLCSGMTQVFFGSASERPERRREREILARSICDVCPVMMDCRRAGRMNHEHGIWGRRERRRASSRWPHSPVTEPTIRNRRTESCITNSQRDKCQT